MTAPLPGPRRDGRVDAVLDMVARDVARARALLAEGDPASADLRLAWAEEAIAAVRPARRRSAPTVVPFHPRRSA